jgi:hypothetical protein
MNENQVKKIYVSLTSNIIICIYKKAPASNWFLNVSTTVLSELVN